MNSAKARSGIFSPDNKAGNDCPQESVSQDGAHVAEKVPLQNDKLYTMENDLHGEESLRVFLLFPVYLNVSHCNLCYR